MIQLLRSNILISILFNNDNYEFNEICLNMFENVIDNLIIDALENEVDKDG